MTNEDRKAAVAAYKERNAAGVYAVCCVPTGQRWVGRAQDLRTIWNRLSFALRQGGSPHRALQAAWRDHGPEAFTFEEVERIDDEAVAFVRDSILKERLAHWRAAFGAEAI